jgi:predicted transcriptional regulator
MLEDVPVKELMRPNPPTVAPKASIGELVYHYLMQTDERAFPVVENGRLLGLVTLEDVYGVAREVWHTTWVREVMTPADQLVVVKLDKDAAETLNKLM